MRPMPQMNQEYLGYRIEVIGRYNPPLLLAHCDVTDGRQQLVCRFSECLDRVLLSSLGWPKEIEEAAKLLVDRALHRARGAILLSRTKELNGQQFVILPNQQLARRTDDYLRVLLLNAFKRVYRHNPMQRGRIDFDDIGVALLENIEPRDVEYILERLQGDDLIKAYAAGHEPGARLYMPTSEGLRLADRISDESNAPALLVEETVAEVERALARYSPELEERLRALSVRVLEARELTHVDVGEIAQSCDLILQEFLDLPVLWEGLLDSRPPRNRTKDRLSLILKAKVRSETEEDLIKGLGDYLFGWFGPLDKFVNKHRHPVDPGQSTRLHAKRLVLYTYLLLADLIELLGL